MTDSTPAEPTKPKSRWPRRILIASGALVLLLICAELGLRLILGLGNPVLYQADAASGYVPVPNQHLRRFFCRNDINSFSMRSPEVLPHKPAGCLRLMFLGDSVTYGTTHVDQSKIFTSLVARDLPSHLHRPVEVLNASTGAWAVENEWGYLRSRGAFDSDWVIFVLNTGDLTQPFTNPDFSNTSGYPDHRPPFATYELWVRYAAPRLLHRAAQVDAGAQASADADLQQTTKVLSALSDARSFTAAHGAQFAIVYSPAHGSQWTTTPYLQGFKMLEVWVEQNNVPFLDLTPYYAAHPDPEIYQDGIHLNESGNRIVKDALLDALEKHWLASAPAR